MAKDILPQHMTAERDGYQRHLGLAVFLALILGIGFAAYAPFFEYIIGYALTGPNRSGALIAALTILASCLYLLTGFDARYVKMKISRCKNFSSLPGTAKSIITGGVKSPKLAIFVMILIGASLSSLALPGIRANFIYEIQSWFSYTQLLLTNPAEAHKSFLSDSTPTLKKGDALSAMFNAMAFAVPIIKYLIWTIAGALIGASIQLFNPYKNLVMKDGYVEWCDDDWLENRMERRWDSNFGWMAGQIGISGGKLMALGRWTGKRRKGEMVKMIETLSMMCLAPPGTGKSLAPHEQLIRYDGSLARADEIKVGDLVMGPDSKSRLVTNITPGFGPMYRITPNKGEPWECNGPHILSLKPRFPSRLPLPWTQKPKFVSVEDYLAWPADKKANWLLWRPAHIEFPPAILPETDPYQFGRNIADRNLEDSVEVYAEDLGQSVHKTIWRPTRIQHHYKCGSRETRLGILAGFIDGCGRRTHELSDSIQCATEPELADDIAFIARSLGFDAAINPHLHQIAPELSLKCMVTISGDIHTIPCKITSTKMIFALNDNAKFTSPFSIERIEDGLYIGMMLNQDHQYLLKDFTVTHNTAGLIVPTIIQDDYITFCVNDPKPELYEMTGGHRETVSAVFMLNWAKVDTINSTNPHKSIFYPRFNFLSPDLVPPPGPNRDTYIDSISRVLIPDVKGGDSYFTDKGRAALTGFLHFLITHASDYQKNYLSMKGRKIDDHREKIDLPPEWRFGQEPSLPMLSDWMAYAQIAATGGGPKPEQKPVDEMTPEEIDDLLERSENPQAAQDPNADNMKIWLLALVNLEIETNGSSRAMVELSSLVNMADKERSGVLGTMDKALLPFKNSAVKQRAGACDFTPDDMRGVFRPEILERIEKEKISTRVWVAETEEGEAILATGKATSDHTTPTGPTTVVWDDVRYRDICKSKASWMPVTLYMSVNQADAAAFASITSLLYEVLANSLISLEPGGYNEKTARVVGPFEVCFALDEFAKLPKTPKLLEGPDLARSKKVSFMIICQSAGQILQIYSKEESQTINATTAVKYIFPQNDSESIKFVQAMVSTTTIKTHSKSTQEGLQKNANPLAWSESDKVEKAEFLRSEDISSIPTGQHLLIVQGNLNHPMRLETPLFFKDPQIKPKVRSRGEGPVATKVVPDYIFVKRQRERIANYEMEKKIAAEEKVADKRREPKPKQFLQILLHGIDSGDTSTHAPH